VLCDLSGNIGLGSMVASLAAGDDPNLSGERLPQGQRLGLAFAPACVHISGQCPCPIPLSVRIRTLRSILDKLEPPAKPQAYRHRSQRASRASFMPS